MSIRKHPFINEQIYHVFNRGVEKRDVFLDDSDYSYFIHDLFILNDKNSFNNTFRSFERNRNTGERMEARPPSVNPVREPLVDILVFTLMPNHFHLMLRQKVDGGISKFMQKLGTSYTMRFNKKYERVGSLFQGKFKAVLVEKDAHFMYLPYYIHTNPISLLSSTERGLASIHQVGFLEKYRWSSLPDYMGEKNFPSVIRKDFLLEPFGNEKKYKKSIERWLQHDNKEKFDSINKVLLD